MIDTVTGYCALITAWKAQCQPLYDRFINYMIESGRYLVTTENGRLIPAKQAIDQISMKLTESQTAGTRQRNNEITSQHSGVTVLDSIMNKGVENGGAL